MSVGECSFQDPPVSTILHYAIDSQHSLSGTSSLFSSARVYVQNIGNEVSVALHGRKATELSRLFTNFVCAPYLQIVRSCAYVTPISHLHPVRVSIDHLQPCGPRYYAPVGIAALLSLFTYIRHPEFLRGNSTRQPRYDDIPPATHDPTRVEAHLSMESIHTREGSSSFSGEPRVPCLSFILGITSFVVHGIVDVMRSRGKAWET